MKKNLNQEILAILKELSEQFDKAVATSVNQVTTEHFQKIESVLAQLEAINLDAKKNPIELGQQILAFHKKNAEILAGFFESPKSSVFTDELVKELNRIRIHCLNNNPTKFPETFGRSYLLKWKKSAFTERFFSGLESSWIRFKQINNSLANILRRITRQKSKALVLPQREVSLEFLVDYQLFPMYLEHLSEKINRLRSDLAIRTLNVFRYEKQIIQNKYQALENDKPTFESDKDLIIKSIQPGDFFDQNQARLLSLIEKEGTWLIKTKKNTRSNKKRINAANFQIDKAAELWQYTFYTLYEDWRFRENLYQYVGMVKQAKLNAENLMRKKIESTLLTEVDDLIAYIEDLIEKLPKPEETSRDAIRSFLKTQLYQLKKSVVNKEDEQEIAANSVEDIPNVIQKFEYDIENYLESLPEKVVVVNSPDYLKGVKQNDLNYFSPVEYIEFELLPAFYSTNKSIKSQLTLHLKYVSAQFKDYDQVIDFYLDTSISLTENETVSEEQIIDVFSEGLHRLLKINENVKNYLSKFLDESLVEITENSDLLLQKLESLDDNDNIFSIYIRLLRSKALSASERKGKFVLGKLKEGFAKASDFYFAQKERFNKEYVKLKQRLHIVKPPALVSSEISNYLIEIERNIKALPVIYQHLFQIAPIREFNLFLSRTDEIEKLSHAYNDFIKGNYSATLLIGENGSGKSSLMYYFSETFKTNYQITYCPVTEFFVSSDDFFPLIDQIFPHCESSNPAELEAYIQSLSEPRIIILDGIERLFSRKVNGFECLQQLLSLILNSGSKLLWICTVSQTAANYLNKTINLFDYFDHKIKMRSLEKEVIKNIVLKRNWLSGYQVVYTETNPGKKNSGKLNSEEYNLVRQKQLEEVFFTALHKFADSNISLSLYFWLESIDYIEDETIFIKELSIPDFSFLENLSLNKAYALLNVVLHGKISAEQFAEINHLTYDESKRVLSIMKEDSILIYQQGWYSLNGFLYRHVLKFLKNRNLIH
ncbi:MAG: ATP-binding protein [Salinivirgaceae bacterium]